MGVHLQSYWQIRLVKEMEKVFFHNIKSKNLVILPIASAPQTIVVLLPVNFLQPNEKEWK